MGTGEEYQKAVDEYLVVRKVWEEDLKQAFEVRAAAEAADGPTRRPGEGLTVAGAVWPSGHGASRHQDYQDVEVKRIEFVRAVLENYLNSERSLRDKNIEVR